MRAYHVFIQASVVAQGLLQYLAVVAPNLVRDSFGSGLRTIRPGIPPSEFVVANALRRTLPDYLLDFSRNSSPIGKIPAVWEFSSWPHEQKKRHS
jgi:hypothetical protein